MRTVSLLVIAWSGVLSVGCEILTIAVARSLGAAAFSLSGVQEQWRPDVESGSGVIVACVGRNVSLPKERKTKRTVN